MFPAQAIAEEMVASGWQVKLSTDSRGARYCENFPSDVEVLIVKFRNLLRQINFGKLSVPLKIFYGVFQSLLWFKETNQAA